MRPFDRFLPSRKGVSATPLFQDRSRTWQRLIILGIFGIPYYFYSSDVTELLEWTVLCNCFFLDCIFAEPNGTLDFVTAGLYRYAAIGLPLVAWSATTLAIQIGGNFLSVFLTSCIGPSASNDFGPCR